MEKMNNKIIEIVLGLSCAIAIVLACGERPDGSCDVWWTIAWFAVAVVIGVLWGEYFNQKPIHITDEAYLELQTQIQEEIDRLCDETHETVTIEADLPDNAVIRLTIDIKSDSSKIRFKDNAWGYTKTFTEYNWHCQCEITDVSVIDSNEREVESDFDEDKLELEFESSEWK